jgi:hypothetical protein
MLEHVHVVCVKIWVFVKTALSVYMALHIINHCPVNCARSVFVRLEIVDPTRRACLTLHLTAMNKYEDNSCLENDICRNYVNGYYGIECLDECPLNFNDSKCERKKKKWSC